jgi:hypothetical protein
VLGITTSHPARPPTHPHPPTTCVRVMRLRKLPGAAADTLMGSGDMSGDNPLGSTTLFL